MDLEKYEGYRVAICGDWHGNTRWAASALERVTEQFPDVKIFLHLGDFGVWHGSQGTDYLDHVQRKLEFNNQVMYVTLGNHENYDLLEMWGWERAGQPLKMYSWPSIIFLPRAWAFQIHDRTFLSFGGASSIDRDLRIKNGWGWWQQEAITNEDVMQACALSSGLDIDVMLTHDTIDGANPEMEEIISTNPFKIPQEALDYSAESRRQVTNVAHTVKPTYLFHGHMHRWGYGRAKGIDTEVFSIPHDGDDKNVGILDLNDLSFEFVNMRRRDNYGV